MGVVPLYRGDVRMPLPPRQRGEGHLSDCDALTSVLDTVDNVLDTVDCVSSTVKSVSNTSGDIDLSRMCTMTRSGGWTTPIAFLTGPRVSLAVYWTHLMVYLGRSSVCPSWLTVC